MKQPRVTPQTYIHQFSNGVTAKATLSTEPPGYAVEWSRNPDPSMFSEYFAWRNGILSDFAASTGGRILVIDL